MSVTTETKFNIGERIKRADNPRHRGEVAVIEGNMIGVNWDNGWKSVEFDDDIEHDYESGRFPI